MALLAWNDRYSVGNAAIDHEHRELIDMINALHACLRSGDRAGAEAAFGDLYREVTAHFALEEQLMRAHRYGEYEGHKSEHEALLDEIRDMMDETGVSDEELSTRLDAWFSKHFSGHDARLHRKLGPV